MAKTKFLWANVKTKLKIFFSSLGDLQLDWLFILLASFIFLDYNLWQRLAFSVGIAYIYKMVIEDIIKIRFIK